MLAEADGASWCQDVETADHLTVVFFYAPWCRNCKADEHPCVCSSVLITTIDQPVKLCKAEIHECLCRFNFNGVWSKKPTGVETAMQTYYPFPYVGWTTGSAVGICRQHVAESDEPKKKKSRTG